MKILANGIPLAGLLTGISRYERCLYNELQQLPNTSVTYCTGPLTSSHMPDQAESAGWSKTREMVWRLPDPVVTGLRTLHWYYFENRLQRCCKKQPVDVYHETTFFPAALRDVPVVYTMYDLSLIKYRNEHPRERLWFFDLFFQRRLPYASHILTISDYVRNEIIEETGVPPDLVTTTYLAADPIFSPREKPHVTETLQNRGWPEEYILFVGTLEPRKNLSLLIKALTRIQTQVPLILVGWYGWGDKEWLRRIDPDLRKRIFIAGHVDEETLACLYSGASAFVFPSLYEGFGLPILEAMACGCPVICSNAASMPEVSGDAAVLIDPTDVDALAHELDQVLTDSTARQSMILRGFERSRQFSWRKTAVKTLEVFDRVARDKSGRSW